MASFSGPKKIDATPIKTWWVKFKTYAKDAEIAGKNLHATEIAMAALIAEAAATSFFTFGISGAALAASIASDAALIIKYRAEYKKDLGLAFGAFAAYCSSVSSITQRHITANTVWKAKVNDAESKLQSELNKERHKIDREEREARRHLKQNSDNVERIERMIQHIAQKKKRANTKSFYE